MRALLCLLCWFTLAYGQPSDPYPRDASARQKAIQAPWEPIRVTWDYGASFTGSSIIATAATRSFLTNELLEPTKLIIQKLLKVKRVNGSLMISNAAVCQDGSSQYELFSKVEFGGTDVVIHV